MVRSQLTELELKTQINGSLSSGQGSNAVRRASLRRAIIDRHGLVDIATITDYWPMVAEFTCSDVATNADTPVGLAEIADLLDVGRQTVDQWRTRGLLPDAAWTVGGRPAWRWHDIDVWARATGRSVEGAKEISLGRDGAEDDVLHKAPSAVLGRRLAYAPIEDCPDLDDLGMRPAWEAARDWQSQRDRAHWHEFAWTVEGRPASTWVREIHGLLGIAGELILTSIEAAAEIQIIRNAMGEEASPPKRAALWRSLRFFAEGQGNNLIMFGHAVANITVRTLALNDGFSVEGIYGLDPSAFLPQSHDQKAWVSLSPKLAREVVKGSTNLTNEAIAMTVSLVELAAGTWSEMSALRGEQYHRWRGESPGVSGIDFGATSLSDELKRTGSVSFGGIPDPYTEGEDIVNQLVDMAQRTLAQVVDWMPHYLDVWGAAFTAARPSLRHPAESV